MSANLAGFVDPFDVAGDVAGTVVKEGWTGIMLSIWSAGLWLLRWALSVMDRFLTPDLSANGPGADVYRTTFWAAGAVVIAMMLVQLGVAAFRRDGHSLARVLIGAAQFGAVWVGWIAYGMALIAACSGLTHALMESLLGIDAWAHWEPLGGYDFSKATIEVALATVLGMLGIFLWIAAIGHFVVMLTRAAALLVLAAVTPIAAAGLVADAGRPWFWKSLRWFHAAAFTPVLTVLVMGIGTRLAGAVSQGRPATAEAALGTAIPAVMLILISLVAPVALFRLLAFVDPGTSSGASLRAGIGAAGGVGGLLGGSSPASGAATGMSAGQSQGEAQRNEATAGRFASVLGGGAGAVGSSFGAGVGMLAHLSTTAATVGIDEMNQTAVGDSSYFPDYSDRGSAQRFNPDQRDSMTSNQSPDDPDGSPLPAPSPIAPHPLTPSAVPAGGGAGTTGAVGGTGAAGGAGAGAAAVPPVA